MLDDLIRRLDDFDPSVRREAIIELGKTRNAAALQALANVVRNDPNPELRDLARKAGIYIRKESEAEQQRNAALASPSLLRQPRAKTGPLTQPTRRRQLTLIEQEEENEKDKHLEAAPLPIGGKGPVPGKKYNVPFEVRQRAKGYIESALNDHIAGRPARAMKNLTEALSLDPNLVNDGYFSNVAGQITGKPADEAIKSIVDRDERKAFIELSTVNEKQGKIDAHMATVNETTRADFYFELVLFALIMFIGPVVVAIIALQGVNGLFASLTTLAEAQGIRIPADIREVQATFSTFNLLTLLPIGIASAVTALVSLVLQMVIVHFLATSLFSANGTLQHLLTTLLKYYNRWLPVLFIIITATVGIFFFSTEISPRGQISPSLMALCPSIILVGFTLFIFSKVSGKIGSAYGRGGAIGLITLFLSGIVLLMLNGMIAVFVIQGTGLNISSLFAGLTPPA